MEGRGFLKQSPTGGGAPFPLKGRPLEMFLQKHFRPLPRAYAGSYRSSPGLNLSAQELST